MIQCRACRRSGNPHRQPASAPASPAGNHASQSHRPVSARAPRSAAAISQNDRLGRNVNAENVGFQQDFAGGLDVSQECGENSAPVVSKVTRLPATKCLMRFQESVQPTAAGGRTAWPTGRRAILRRRQSAGRARRCGQRQDRQTGRKALAMPAMNGLRTPATPARRQIRDWHLPPPVVEVSGEDQAVAPGNRPFDIAGQLLHLLAPVMAEQVEVNAQRRDLCMASRAA